MLLASITDPIVEVAVDVVDAMGLWGVFVGPIVASCLHAFGASAAAAALFGGGDLHELQEATLAAALREAGAVTLSGELPGIVDLLVESGLARSKGEARRTVTEGGAYLNNARVEDPELVPTRRDLVAGSWLVLRRGKKRVAGVEVVAR